MLYIVVHIQGEILSCDKHVLSWQGRSLPFYRQEIWFHFIAALDQRVSVNDSIFWDIGTMSTAGTRPGSTMILSGLPNKSSFQWTPTACGREVWDKGWEGCKHINLFPIFSQNIISVCTQVQSLGNTAAPAAITRVTCARSWSKSVSECSIMTASSRLWSLHWKWRHFKLFKY